MTFLGHFRGHFGGYTGFWCILVHLGILVDFDHFGHFGGGTILLLLQGGYPRTFGRWGPKFLLVLPL